MDAEYLKENVGAALAIGLAETAIAQPDDPIEYFALWLTKYVQNQKRGQQVFLLLSHIEHISKKKMH